MLVTMVAGPALSQSVLGALGSWFLIFMVSNLHQSSQGRIISFAYFADEDTEAQK